MLPTDSRGLKKEVVSAVPFFQGPRGFWTFIDGPCGGDRIPISNTELSMDEQDLYSDLIRPQILQNAAMEARWDRHFWGARIFTSGLPVGLLLVLLVSCAEGSAPPVGATPAMSPPRRFTMTVRAPGEEPVDLSDQVRNPAFVVAYPSAEADLRAEVHGNGSPALAEGIARNLYESIVEAGRILGRRPRGAVVLHLVALPRMPRSYRFEVSYKDGDAGVRYLFETAYFYTSGQDPLRECGAGSLRATVYHTIPHEVAHAMCRIALSYHPVMARGERSGSMTFHAPRWLDDGIAEFVGARVQAKMAPDLERPYSQETGRHILRTLGPHFLDWPDPGQSAKDWKGLPDGDCYAAAFVLVEALVGGEEQTLRRLLGRMEQSELRDHADLRNLIRNLLHTDPEALIEQLSKR